MGYFSVRMIDDENFAYKGATFNFLNENSG
jgi:hypothetical protein